MRIYLYAALMAAACFGFFLLTGCAAPGHSKFAWVYDPHRIKCQSMPWRQVSYSEMISLTGSTTMLAAAFGCNVVSPYSEEEAKVVQIDGESLWAHEARHVFEQMEHPKGSK